MPAPPLIALTTSHLDRDNRISAPIGYARAVVKAGGIPVHLPPAIPENLLDPVLDRIRGIILTGGFDINPHRYGARPHPRTARMSRLREEFDFALLAAALRRKTPILAICLGIQEVNVAFGGTLHQHIPGAVHRAPGKNPYARHAVTLAPGTRIRDICGKSRFVVNSSHHQTVDALGRGLAPTAYSDDLVLEGLEHPGYPFLIGVQWHPERMIGNAAASDRIFRAFVAAAMRRP
ncbi:MAG: gamma-glutamyl-gamma-aminobutyrate hydrolase family protein [Planctomycetota bacterium]